MTRTKPMIIAHRGLSGYYPENTLLAFQEALKLPIDAVEFDVRRTKDGVLVVIHDETVDRTTNGSGYVGSFTLDEINKLDAGSWKGKEFAETHITSLDETLEVLDRQSVLVIEIKEPGTESQIIETVKRYNALEWINLVSFHANAIASAKKIEPHISCALIGGKSIGASDNTFFDFVHATLGCDANSVMVHYSTLTPKRVHYCHKRFLSVGTWTVDDKNLAERLILMGVDAIASNYPDVMLEAMAA